MIKKRLFFWKYCRLIFIILSLVFIAYEANNIFQWSTSIFEECNGIFNERNESSSYISEVSFNTCDHIVSSKLFLKQDLSINIYLKSLENSVRIINAPITKSLSTAIDKCKSTTHVKINIKKNDYGMEFLFPTLLHQMHSLYISEFRKRIVFTSNLIEFNIVNSVNDRSQEPLFYYLQTHLYFTAHYSSNNIRSEDWQSGLDYIREVAKYVVTLKEWRENMGIDFLSTLSHPKSGPLKVHPASLHYFLRQTFLRCDFDLSGYHPKDIIIPYYIDASKLNIESNEVKVYSLNIHQSHHQSTYLERKFTSSLLSDKSGLGPGTTGVDFSISSSSFRMSADDYQHQLLQSEFCLVLRGDTSSSKRLFSAILHDCIPVIVSDWLPLPFELLVDYSLFSLRLPEASYRRIDQVVAHLRNVSDVQKSDLHRYLRLVQPIFRYDQPVHIDNIRPPQLFLLNPVTMTLLEAVIRRKTYCDSLSMTAAVSSMCSKLYRRIHHASKNIQSYK